MQTRGQDHRSAREGPQWGLGVRDTAAALPKTVDPEIWPGPSKIRIFCMICSHEKPREERIDPQKDPVAFDTNKKKVWSNLVSKNLYY